MIHTITKKTPFALTAMLLVSWAHNDGKRVVENEVAYRWHAYKIPSIYH